MGDERVEFYHEFHLFCGQKGEERTQDVEEVITAERINVNLEATSEIQNWRYA